MKRNKEREIVIIKVAKAILLLYRIKIVLNTNFISRACCTFPTDFQGYFFSFSGFFVYFVTFISGGVRPFKPFVRRSPLASIVPKAHNL